LSSGGSRAEVFGGRFSVLDFSDGEGQNRSGAEQGAILNESAQGKASNGRNSWLVMAERAEEAKTCERHEQHEPQDAGRAL